MSPLIAKIRDRIRRVGWCETARRSGVGRMKLWRNFARDGNPKLETIEAVLPHIGLELTVTEIDQCHSPQ